MTFSVISLDVLDTIFLDSSIRESVIAMSLIFCFIFFPVNILIAFTPNTYNCFFYLSSCVQIRFNTEGSHQRNVTLLCIILWPNPGLSVSFITTVVPHSLSFSWNAAYYSHFPLLHWQTCIGLRGGPGRSVTSVYFNTSFNHLFIIIYISQSLSFLHITILSQSLFYITITEQNRI